MYGLIHFQVQNSFKVLALALWAASKLCLLIAKKVFWLLPQCSFQCKDSFKSQNCSQKITLEPTTMSAFFHQTHRGASSQSSAGVCYNLALLVWNFALIQKGTERSQYSLLFIIETCQLPPSNKSESRAVGRSENSWGRVFMWWV